MKMTRLAYTFLFLICYIFPISAQDTLFFENFDSSTGTKPPGWTSELETGDSKWQFVTGGGTKFPEIPGSGRPPAAASGTVNALYFYESLGGEEVILVTPPVNLEFALRPELRFMHVQREGNLGFGAANDELRIYYKTHFDSTWREVRKIAEYTDEVYDWTEQVVILPEEAFVQQCYFAFKAKTNFGWGVGIDDVMVIETEIQPRQVEEVVVVQEDTSMLPTGSIFNSLLRIDVSVKGNSGAISLESLDVSSLNDSDSDISTDGVKLYYNHQNMDFYAATLLYTASFISGEAQFSSLDFNLPSGRTSLWISCDISEDAVHNNRADVMLKAGSIQIGGNGFPATDASPSGSRLIQEAVFYDDFLSDQGWALSGDFERDVPLGLGRQFLGNPDPEYAAGDTMILGNDLSGLGENLGAYEPGVSKYGNLAISPVLDLFYYNQVKLNFLRWLNVANNDTASIEMSLDGGSNWDEIWSNDNNIFKDGEWTDFSLDMPKMHRQAQVQVRFNLGPTTPTDHLSGWNIDNFAITGNYVEYDVSPITLLSPGRGCGHSAAETVSIRVANLGPEATPNAIPVRYSFDGGTTFTSDIISGSIAFEGSRDFDFSDRIDLSTPGVYDVVIETDLDVDEEAGNNRLDTTLYVDPTYPLPYYQDFEEGTDFWRAEGANTSFEHGTPMGSVIHTVPSGINAWVTNLDGIYSNEEDGYLTGPCYDFTGIDYPVFECKLYLHTEADKDGANLEYSLDNGQSWTRLGNLGDGAAYDWNWYNSDVISSLDGGNGWTGEQNDWFTARFMLDTTVFRNTSGVKFRFHFASDASGRFEGIGIDDIRLYGTPRDVGVVSIENPVNGCAQEIGDYVAVTIKNFGKDTLMAGESIVVGYDFDSLATVIDTFVLTENVLSGATTAYMFTKPLVVTTEGWMDMEAFTLLSDDVDFYNEATTNDTILKSVEILQTPFVFLPEHIYSVRTDTLILDANTGDPTDTYLWQDGSTDPLFQVTAMDNGMYYVTASNAYCGYSDTSYVHRLIADVGVTAIWEPVDSSCELGAAVRPWIEVTNFGSDTLDAGDEIPVRYQIDANPAVEEVVVLSSRVLPDSTFEYNFATASDMSEIRLYSFTAYTELEYDDTLANDAMTVPVEVLGYTPVDLGEDIAIRAFDYTIDAGSGYDTYLWLDGSSDQTLVVDTTGLYWVTVKQDNMCENTDTLLVTFIIPDMGIERLSNPSDGCGLSTAESLEFYAVNVGTDTLYANDSLFISYQFEGGSWIEDTLLVDRLIEPGDSILYSSDSTVDVSVIGTYDFSVELSLKEDLILENNQLNQTVQVFASPVISLGGDRVVNARSFVLDAGAGFVSYVWQDWPGEQQYVVEIGNQSPDSLYRVRATDVHGCMASDEVMISFDLWDVGVSSMASPETSCLLSEREDLRLYVTNFGSNPIVDEQVNIVYRVDGGTLVTAQYTLSQVLNPGDSTEYLLGTSFDFSAQGDHSIVAYSAYGNDGDSFNDTLDVVVTHLGLPAPELGGQNDTLGTALPLTLDAGEGFVSYQWNGEDGNRTYDAAQYGWYKLEVTDPDGCFSGDSVYLNPATGVEDFQLEGKLKVYPIPASRVLFIEYSGEASEDLTLELIDATGREILIRPYPQTTEIKERLLVGEMNRGIYYLRLRSEERQMVKRIVLN